MILSEIYFFKTRKYISLLFNHSKTYIQRTTNINEMIRAQQVMESQQNNIQNQPSFFTEPIPSQNPAYQENDVESRGEGEPLRLV